MNTKFCFKLGKTRIEIYELLQTVCGKEALCSSRIFEWFKRFKDGREIFRMIQKASSVLQLLEMCTQSQMCVKCRYEIIVGLLE
jgi:hypothetical protein